MTHTSRIRKITLLSSLAITTLVLAGCSADPLGGDGSTAPTARADLAVSGDPITICTDDCVFEQQGANRGLGCAAKIEGTTRIRHSDGRTLATVAWKLDPSWVVRPGETFLYDGCCFKPRVMKYTVRYETEFRWDNVACPAS